MPILDVKNLSVSFDTVRGPLSAVHNLNLQLKAGESLGIVGESGSGKSVSSLALMGLLPNTATIDHETMKILGNDLKSMKPKERRHILGRDISMIFQDPMTSLNPSLSIGFQLSEGLKRVFKLKGKELNKELLGLMEKVGIDDGERVLKSYPHELSGGMNQRVMIAMAISCKPKLLIADEPTTALDVTIQKQILDLIADLQKEMGMALILITHDIGVVANRSDSLAVMYAGEIVESGPTQKIIESPRHPYTVKLLECLPGSTHSGRLKTIPGLVPDLTQPIRGCRLAPRCDRASSICHSTEPNVTSLDSVHVRCHDPVEAGLG